MGAVKKVFKGLGSMLGIGGNNDTPSVQTVDTTPVNQTVTNSDVSLASDGIANTKRDKNNIRKLATATDNGVTTKTVVGGASSDDKRTFTGA